MLARNSMPVKSLTCAQASTPTPKASYLLAGSRALGLFTSIRLILLTLRHNLTQELLAELFEISHSMVSRRCQRLHPTHRRGPPRSGSHPGRPPDPTTESSTDAPPALLVLASAISIRSCTRAESITPPEPPIQVACIQAGRPTQVPQPLPDTHPTTSQR